MTNSTLEEKITSQISRFVGLRFEWLEFPRQLEDRFERDTSAKRCARLWLEGLFAIFLFDLFLAADFLYRESFNTALVIRLGVITPLALAVNLSMLRRPNKIFREASIAFVACLAGLTHLYLESNTSAVITAFAQFAALAVILFANVQMRLRFPYAIAATMVMLLGDLVFLKTDRLLHHDQKILGLILFLGTTAITLISNYSANREERLNYLLCLRGDVLVDDLSRSNQKLIHLAEVDSLTGLANRRAFDIKYQTMWRSASAEKSWLSVIIVDVDHFKRLNDTYGHLYGDKVLKRIAHLLTEALRMKGDFAARFGGEEFVILLPETSLDSALLVADRLRRLVEVAGFPAMQGVAIPVGSGSATVSCGVAVARPGPDTQAQHLLEAADKALYEAKSTGRNKVCCATALVEVTTSA